MDKIISLMITAVMTVTSCSFKGENPLDGKRIAFIGDSISYGTNWQGGYGKLIGEQYNMNVTNVSKGGATLADMCIGRKIQTDTDRILRICSITLTAIMNISLPRAV